MDKSGGGSIKPLVGEEIEKRGIGKRVLYIGHPDFTLYTGGMAKSVLLGFIDISPPILFSCPGMNPHVAYGKENRKTNLLQCPIYPGE